MLGMRTLPGGADARVVARSPARIHRSEAAQIQAGLAKRQTASIYLKQLSDLGILDGVKVGRDKLFIHLKLVTLLKSEQHAFPRYDS
jgi:hypothetical protein